MAGERAHVANIGDRGVRRRRLGGYVWTAVAAAGLIAFLITCAPRSLRLALFVPLFLASLGFQQARERT
jgi:hypothetical protein